MAKSHKKKRLQQRYGTKKSSSKPKVSKEVHKEAVVLTEEKKSLYDKYYKHLLLIPFLMLLAAFVIIGVQVATTGDFVNRGISLSGGTSIGLTNDMLNLSSLDVVDLQSHLLSKFPKSEFNIRFQKQLTDIIAVEIETDMTSKEDINTLKTELVSYLPELDDSEVSTNIKTSGSVLGASFFRQVMWAMLVAFILMGAVIFIQFKVPIPSFAVILAAFSDMTVTLAVIDVMGVKLSTAGIAAFLMLIGYSVDTDVLLSTRVLKNKHGTVNERIRSAVKTGLTMNITTLVAVGVGLLVANSQTLKQIMLILFIGLLVDMINTWIQNVGILRWYVDRKKARADASHELQSNEGQLK